jgi:hypothetical protein
MSEARARRRSGKPFDDITKFLLETEPAAWPRLLGLAPLRPCLVVDSDVATVSAAADKVVRVESPTPWLLHLEFQSAADASLPERLHFYNTLLIPTPLDGAVKSGDWLSVGGQHHRDFGLAEQRAVGIYGVAARAWYQTTAPGPSGQRGGAASARGGPTAAKRPA